MNLGNKNDAELIYRRRKTGMGPLPKGWKKLGAGAYRTSYLSPDKVVYKVAHPWENDTNVLEFSNYRRIRSSKVRLPKGWSIAPTQMYSFTFDGETVNIIAMQYIEGNHRFGLTDYQADAWLDKIGAYRAFDKCDLYDTHEGNFVITPTGKKVIIDLGA